MIAYNNSGLENRRNLREAAEAERENLISAEEHADIRRAFKDPFYSPPFFARLGFFVLTCICISFGLGFFAALTSFDSASNFVIQTFLAAITCFGALEWLIRNKQHLRSGVDDAFLYVAFGLAIGGCFLIQFNMSPILQWSLFLILASACVVRYADRLMALIALGSLLLLAFFTGLKIGPVGKALLPFILMLISAIVYSTINACDRKKSLRNYRPVFSLLKTSALICLYVAGNYFVVREANSQMSENPSGPSPEIPFAWFFWVITIGLPAFFIWLGLKRKERFFLVTGLILIAATVFTIRYYHGFLAPEWAMLLGGLFLLAVAAATMKYLKSAKNGITAAKQGPDPLAGLAQIEALIIDETLSPVAMSPEPRVVFGGGSGGGGGAGGQF